jgi:hypothetical protein
MTQRKSTARSFAQEAAGHVALGGLPRGTSESRALIAAQR